MVQKIQKLENTVYTGTVLWFSDRLGYGFLECSDFTKSIFVHFSRINNQDPFKTLSRGQIVLFDVANTNKGFMAVNIREDKIIKPKVEVILASSSIGTTNS